VYGLRELARRHTPAAIATLAQIMKDKKAPPAARVVAANSLLDRGFDKPVQTVESSIKHEFSEISTEQIIAELRALGVTIEATAIDEQAPPLLEDKSE
jgi:hypothetical protein